MKRSEHGRYIRGLVADLVDLDRPADTAALRAAINNGTHVLDQRGQTLAAMSGNWSPPESYTGGWTKLWGFAEPIVPLTVLPSGDSVAIVTHLFGHVGSGSGTVAFRVQITRSRGSIFPFEPTDEWCSEVTTSSTSPVSLTPDPLRVPAIELGDVTPLQDMPGRPVPLSRWRDGLTEIRSADSTLGASAYATILFARLQVWACATSGTALPRLRSFTAREYITG